MSPYMGSRRHPRTSHATSPSRPLKDFGLVSRFNTPMAGVRVTVKRTGGIAAQPDSISVVTGPDGRFNASAFRISSLGDLIVSLTITPPAPLPAFRIDNVRLTALDGDPQ